MWTWRASLAVCGLLGGVIAAIVGTLLLTVVWATGSESGGLSLHNIGSILLLSTIPLLIVGACCLDSLENREKKSHLSAPEGTERGTGLSSHSLLHVAVITLFLLLLCGAHSNARAQQTVFNVPTTDVLPAAKVYFELDVSVKPNDAVALIHFSSFVPRIVVGMGGNVEIGLNVLGNIQPGPDSTTLAPAIKWRFYNGGDNGWMIAAGSHLYVPVRNKAYNAGNYSYVMTQKSFTSGTRVGFGGYFYSRNVVAPGAIRTGGQFTFEQPVTEKLNVNADWFTGKHANGYLTTGAAYKWTDKLTGVAAYSIGNANARRGNHFIYFEAGYNFN